MLGRLGRSTKRITVLLALGAIASGCGDDGDSQAEGPQSQAARGTAVLTFSPEAVVDLRAAQITVEPILPARRLLTTRPEGAPALPISIRLLVGDVQRRADGRPTPNAELRGGFVLRQRGGDQARVQQLQVRTLIRHITAQIGEGDTTRLFGLQRQRVDRSGDGLVGRWELDLEGNGFTTLRDVFDSPDGRIAFKPGGEIGSLVVRVSPRR